MLNPNIPGPVRVSILERLVPSFAFSLAALSGAVGAIMLLTFLRAMRQAESAGYAAFYGGIAELEFAVGIVLVFAAAFGAIGILVSAIRLFTTNAKASPPGILFLLAGLLGLIPPLALRYILQLMKGVVNSPTPADGGISAVTDTIMAVSYFTIGSAGLIALIMLAFTFVPFSSASGRKASTIIFLVVIEILIAALAGVYFWEATKSLTERNRDRPEFGQIESSESSVDSSNANSYQATFPPELESNTPDNTAAANSPMSGKTISGGVINSKAINLQQPPYPPAARAVGAKGAVSVQVLVNEQGEVVSANAVSGHPLLRPAAVQAARGTRFVVTKLSGQPVKVSGVLTFRFE